MLLKNCICTEDLEFFKDAYANFYVFLWLFVRRSFSVFFLQVFIVLLGVAAAFQRTATNGKGKGNVSKEEKYFFKNAPREVYFFKALKWILRAKIRLLIQQINFDIKFDFFNKKRNFYFFICSMMSGV